MTVTVNVTATVTVTVLEMIESAAAQLTAANVSFGHGTQNAHDEAAWLVLWRLGYPLEDLDSVKDEAVTPEQAALVAALLTARIETRKPAAYLTQEAWLQGVPFFVDERVIVPRSLIAELLADGGFDAWLGDATRRVLDLCTGGGSLAILAAMAYPEVSVLGIDVSQDALDVARINIQRHALQQRIGLRMGDGLTACTEVFDLILCNPPYVSAASMATLPPEYRAEPAIALDGNSLGGSDGMDFIRGLMKDAARCLSGHGLLVLEVGQEHDHFEAAFPRLEAVWLDTSAGPDHVLLLTRDALVRGAFSPDPNAAGARRGPYPST